MPCIFEDPQSVTVTVPGIEGMNLPINQGDGFGDSGAILPFAMAPVENGGLGLLGPQALAFAHRIYASSGNVVPEAYYQWNVDNQALVAT